MLTSELHIVCITNEGKHGQNVTKALSILDHVQQIEYFVVDYTIIARLVLFSPMIEML